MIVSSTFRGDLCVKSALLVCSVLYAFAVSAGEHSGELNSHNFPDFVEFRSIYDDDSSGHAYITLGKYEEDGSETFDTSIGYYAVSPDTVRGEDSVAVFYKTFPSAVVGEGKNPVFSDSFRVHITPSMRSSVLLIAEEWKDIEYQPIWRNCVHFVRTVADAVGLNNPPLHLGNRLPRHMVSMLRDNNGEFTGIIKQSNIIQKRLSDLQTQFSETQSRIKDNLAIARKQQEILREREFLNSILPKPFVIGIDLSSLSANSEVGTDSVLNSTPLVFESEKKWDELIMQKNWTLPPDEQLYLRQP